MTRRKPIPTDRVPVAVEEAVVEVALEVAVSGIARPRGLKQFVERLRERIEVVLPTL